MSDSPEFNPETDLVMVDDVDAFAALITNWHDNKLAQLNHALTVPDEVDVEVTDDATGQVVILTAEQRVGFRAGLVMAKALFGELPFEAKFELVTGDEEQANGN